MANFRRLSALVAIYLGAFASAQSNTTQQGQGSVLSTQQIASLSCQNARDAAAGGTSGANILLSNAMISAGPQDQISVQNIRQAQSSLAQSQLALSRIQTNAISGQQPALQDMQSAMTSFVQAGQAVNAALLSSSQPPPGAAGNASAPVLAAEQIPVITSLGPEMKQLILNLNTASSTQLQSNIGASALQLNQVTLAMQKLMSCSGAGSATTTSSGNSTQGAQSQANPMPPTGVRDSQPKEMSRTSAGMMIRRRASRTFR